MGKLILLTLPIGNLQDLSERVKNALREGENFLVEDTRSFKQLLHHLNIEIGEKKITSFHDQSGDEKKEQILQQIIESEENTLYYAASEAGSPVLSDPFYLLVRQALVLGIEVDSYSGISALTMALELSGLPPLPATFLGFLPRNHAEMLQTIKNHLQHSPTVVFFESPHRIIDTLDFLTQELVEETEFFIARELTKKFQSCYSFTKKDWEKKKEELVVKGEFTLVIHQAQSARAQKNLGISQKMLDLSQQVLSSKGRKKELSKLLALILERSTEEIYKELI